MQLSFNTCHFVLMVAAASAAVSSAADVFVNDPIDLGGGCGFAVLAKSGISTVPNSVINGDIGVSPIAATAMTGFSLTGTAVPLQFSSSAQVTGKCLAADYGAPISETLTKAILDIEAAHTAANNLAPNYAENLYGGNLSGKTLYPGVYHFTVVINMNEDITLDAQNEPNAVFVFTTTFGTVLSPYKKVLLAGGALAENIFWSTAGVALVDVGAHSEGTFLSYTGITINTGGSVNGRLLAQTAVTLQMATINESDCATTVQTVEEDAELFC
jgi:hypothetical protein